MKEFKRKVALWLVICLCINMIGCRPATGPSETTVATEPTGNGETVPQTGTYTVKVTSESGAAFAGLGVFVYEDATKEELVWFAKTDDTGSISFNARVSEGYVAFLDKAPDGYEIQENYPLTGLNTEIVLPIQMAGAEDYVGKTFSLGDVMWDLTVTDVNGVTHQLSKLLEEKEAVMLNFWYMDCAPCRMEFPYLQNAYETRSDKLAVLALNTVDTDEAAIAAFAQQNGLTMPVAKCDSTVANALQVAGYPTTVMIDRNGIISLVHQGGITGADTFGDVMDYFTAEDYQPGVITDVNTIITPEDNSTEDII